MPDRLIAIGASSGGLEVLETIIAGLPADLDAAVMIVLHLAPDSPGMLPRLLARQSKLPVAHAVDGEPLHAGHVYVAPPDRHLVIDGGAIRLTRGPRENFSRPAIDPLFRSASLAYGPRVIGVVLSGRLDDGTAGLWSIKDRGGVTIVQDPQDASAPSMPRSAATYVAIDHCLPGAEIAGVLASICRATPAEVEAARVTRQLEVEDAIARGANALALGVMELGPITPYTCPECHGVLVALEEGGTPRFRCHSGHAYSLKSLLAEVTDYVESALWNATRSMEQGLLLMQHAAQHLRERGDPAGAEIFASKA
jgi:two-component system, chemotaxis family, protein-glutamate methylesterase/glutaminase